MTTTTSHGNPLAEVSDGDIRARVYEEVPGHLTVSFSQSPGMWASFTAPAGSLHLVSDVISAALAARNRLGEPCPDCHVLMTAENGLKYCPDCDAYHGETAGDQ